MSLVLWSTPYSLKVNQNSPHFCFTPLHTFTTSFVIPVIHICDPSIRWKGQGPLTCFCSPYFAWHRAHNLPGYGEKLAQQHWLKTVHYHLAYLKEYLFSFFSCLIPLHSQWGHLGPEGHWHYQIAGVRCCWQGQRAAGSILKKKKKAKVQTPLRTGIIPRL